MGVIYIKDISNELAKHTIGVIAASRFFLAAA